MNSITKHKFCRHYVFLFLTQEHISLLREPQDITNTKSNAAGRRHRPPPGLSSSDNDIHSLPLHSPTAI
jgi:hypothetical protein